MKINRRKAGVFLLSGVVVAAAIAIPIGIIYGSASSDSTTPVTNGEARFNYSTNTSKEKINLAYGTFAESTVAPVLDPETGYKATEYKVGEFSGTTFVTTDGVANSIGKTVTYKYLPIKSTDPIVYVTYALNVTKGQSKTLDAFAPAPETVAYGETVLPKVNGNNDINAYLYSLGFGYSYKGVASATNPRYEKSDGTPLTADMLKTLDVGQTFSIKYDADFDSANYVDNGLPATHTFEFDYNVVKREVFPPAEVTNPDGQLVYGSTYTLSPAPTAAQYYTLSSATPQTRVATKPTGATNTPDEDQPIVVADANKYEVGTVFEVKYTYKVVDDTKYTGADYTYTFTTTVTSQPIQSPSDANTTKAEKTYQFGLPPTEFGSGATKTQPANPTYANYVTDTPAVGTVTQASTVTTGKSPAMGSTVTWADVATYNSGTKFEVVYSYKAAPNYQGQPFTVKQPYLITKQKVAIPTKTQNPQNTTSYNKGSDPATLTSPVPAAHFTLTGTKYYLGTTVDTTKVQTAAQIEALTGNDDFTVQWTYTLDSSNYEPSSGTTTTYTETTSYKVIAGSASYIGGKTTYDPASMDYSDALPTDFVPSNLPEPSKNIGYVYKGVAYTIQTAATDTTSTPAVGQEADISVISQYGAGAVILATFTFEADKPGYSGGDITATKTLTIKKKAVTKPTSTTLTNMNFTYGTTVAQPTDEPRTFAGFEGTYTSAAFSTRPSSGTGSTAAEAFSWANFDKYAKDTVVTITWTYKADVNHESPDFTTTQTYTIANLAQATEPPVADKTLADVNEPFGTTNLSTLPANPKESLYTGYVLDTTPTATKAVIDTQSSNTDTTNGQLRPAPNATVVWTDVTHYNAGTTFTLTYTYKPDGNHSGNTFIVTRTYNITTAAFVKEPDDKTLPAVNSKFGADLTGAPTNPNDYAGYKLKSTETKVTAKSSLADGYNSGTNVSPNDGDTVTWSAVKTYNTGTKFTVTYTYESDDNHADNTFTVTKDYTIVKADAGTVPTDLSATGEDIAFGANTYQSTPQNPEGPYEGFILTDATVKVSTASTLTDADSTHVSPPKDAVVDWAKVSTYNTGTQFTVTYLYGADANHNGSSTFRVTKIFTIVAADAPAAPTPLTLTEKTQTFGTNMTAAPDNPNKDNTDYNGFVLKETKAVITHAGTRTADANHLNPTVGADVVWADVAKYNADTKFTITYKYENDGNHKTKAFEITQVYKITAKTAVKPATPSIPASSVSYGTTVAANGNVALPTASTASYASSNFSGSVGYDNGTASKPKVVTKSTTAYVMPASNSPDNGTELEWGNLKDVNAGTVFESDITYNPTSEYDGSPFTVKRRWTIIPQKINVKGDPNQDFRYGNYSKSTDANLLFALTTDAATQNSSHKIDLRYYFLDVTDFFTGTNGSPQPKTAAQIQALPVGSTFTAKTYIVLNGNYSNSGGSQFINYRPTFAVVA